MARKASVPPRVTFWGAAHTVTGSMHLVETRGMKVLLDCGIFQGRRAEAYQRNRTFPFTPSEIDAVILSHGHIDHIGNLPHLVRMGFSGPIYCTPATRDLLAVMLEDAAHIQEEDAHFLNHKRPPGTPKIEPLFAFRDVVRTLKQVQTAPYHRPVAIDRKLTFRFLDAGHLLGSAMIHLTLAGAERDVTVTFTGDLGRKGTPILRDPEPIPPADLLICESTYGGRVHPPIEELADDLVAVIQRTFERGGKVFFPAFSLGRTQNVVYFLHKVIAEGKLPTIPIFVDSPLAVAATEVFRLHPECFDEETALVLSRDPDLFGRKLVRYTRSVQESKELNMRKEPCVVIAASGMCEMGRIVHHLKYNISDARNTVAIIGYQAPDTLGRRLVERRPEVRIHDQFIPLRAEVVVMNGFSSHADSADFRAALAPLAGQFKKTRLVHGEADQALALKATLESLGFADVAYPERGDSVVIE